MQKGMQRKLKRRYVCIRSPQREKRNTNVYMSKGEQIQMLMQEMYGKRERKDQCIEQWTVDHKKTRMM